MATKKSDSQPREMNRTRLSVAERHELLMEAGYKCGNPTCRNIITLEIHHIQYVSEGGGDEPSNLLPLCPYCHTMHHQAHIPVAAIRTWKSLLLALNHALDRRSLDLLLYLRKMGGKNIEYSGDGLLQFAGLVASGLVEFDIRTHHALTPPANIRMGGMDVMHHPVPHSYSMYAIVRLTVRGNNLLAAWLSGDEHKFIEVVSEANVSTAGPFPK